MADLYADLKARRAKLQKRKGPDGKVVIEMKAPTVTEKLGDAAAGLGGFFGLSERGQQGFREKVEGLGGLLGTEAIDKAAYGHPGELLEMAVGGPALGAAKRGAKAVSKVVAEEIPALLAAAPKYEPRFLKGGGEPAVPQFDLPRNVPKKGVSARVTDLTQNPEVRARMEEVIKKGLKMGGADWYNAEPLRREFVAEMGEEEGTRAFNKYMDFVAATSPRSDVGSNVRNASYYYQKWRKGEAMPEVGEKNPAPYGHLAQRLHQQNAAAVAGPGWDPLKNPKPASFAQNLQGNQRPATIDTHAFRLPAIQSRDHGSWRRA